jgi:lysophospholipase L1-like esterase
MHVTRTAGAAVLLSIAALIVGCEVPPASTRPVSIATPTSPGAAPDEIASMIVIGHSGATGWNSEPDRPGQDARYNSWASGNNPAVDSIYQRLLPTNPALTDHAVNQAVSGSKANDLDRQIDTAFALAPKPDLILIQTVDNDIRCDGTDDSNYKAFHDTLAAALSKLATQSPDAVILIVSSPWATVTDYVSVVATLPGGKAQFAGTGPCDLFDTSGRPARAHMRYQQDVIDKYLAQVAAACKQVPTCHYDNGALAHLAIAAADLTTDYNHLNVTGQAKQAALEWKVLAPLLTPH